MKLWEVVKELSENPKKKYEAIDDGLYKLTASYRNGYIVFQAFAPNGDEINGANAYKIDQDWQEIKQPVPWQEAIQAWLDNDKDIYVVRENGERIDQSESYRFGIFGDGANGFNRHDFTQGKWFIE